ncbi:hypothetical protein CLU79DRAFT_775469 [Phycomyces nitens]|nr:hypothetical protein CLU79DRAFT_775469 [Phycomyces nitens]
MLPQELIIMIANNLSTKDRLVCSTVCKAWKDPFQRSLWRSIELNAREKLWMVCYDSKKKGSKYDLNGHCTHELLISFTAGIDNQDFHTLLFVFPSLRALKIEAEILPTVNLSRAPGQPYWNMLTSLDIIPPRYKDEAIIVEFARLLTFTPNVRYLGILQSSSKGIECGWRDIEVVHESLPLLIELEISINLVDLEDEDTKDIARVQPSRVTRLIINSFDQSIFWVYYFACKYPDVQTIKCSLLGDQSDYEETDILYPKLAELSSPFQKLKTLETNSNLAEMFKHDVFYVLLHKLGVKLKNVTCVLDWEEDPQMYSSMDGLLYGTFTGIFNSIQESVERLSISSPTILKEDGLFANISICTTLIDLELRINSEHVELENIIRHFPSLKKLAIDSSDGSELVNPPKILPDNCIEILKLEMLKISQEALRTISCNLTHLKKMVLSNVTIWGNVSVETGEFCINMSSTRFEYLQLEDVHFHHYYLGQSCFCINFSAVLQSDYREQPESEKKRLRHSQKYFESRRKKTRSASKPDRHQNSCQGHLGHDTWRDDLSRGYAILRCKAADKLYIEGCRAHNIFPE